MKLENCLNELKLTVKSIENLYLCKNIGLLDSINFIICKSNYIEQKKMLESLLNYENYLNKPLYTVYNWLPEIDHEEVGALGSELQQSLGSGDSVCGVACLE